MKKYYGFLKHGVASRVALCLGLLTIATSSRAVDITFTATFQAPTCEVSAPATLDFGSVVSSEIKQGLSQGIIAGRHAFTMFRLYWDDSKTRN
ncbi:hypothetical protein LNN85_07260 [Klebsiella pneumoniae subsp. pneumoniae]|nr:hypothetical protein [Klebsiella pneumoniae subsp. pneumoniae]